MAESKAPSSSRNRLSQQLQCVSACVCIGFGMAVLFSSTSQTCRSSLKFNVAYSLGNSKAAHLDYDKTKQLSNEDGDTKRDTDKFQTFHTYWCIHRRFQYDWELILRSCSNKKMSDHIQVEDTSAEHSRISEMSIEVAGEFSSFVITACTAKGEVKHTGGDYWIVKARGPETVVGAVVDEDDGSYSVSFLPTLAGLYRIDITLRFTNCRGLINPPSTWFGRGNYHGYGQHETNAGIEKDILNTQLLMDAITIIASPVESSLHSIQSLANPELTCPNDPCKSHDIWDGFGTWRGTKTFVPYIQTTRKAHSAPQPLNGSLMLYGDSVSGQLLLTMTNFPPFVCGFMFQNCTHLKTYVYNVEDKMKEVRSYDRKKFDFHRVVQQLRGHIMSRPDVSILVLNYGLHFTRTTMFTEFTSMIDAVVEMLEKLQERKLMIVWRTATYVEQERLSLLANMTAKELMVYRYMTGQRGQLYDAYATQQMCKAKHLRLNSYQITAGYPNGTKDGVHFVPAVEVPTVKVFHDYFS